MNRIRTLLWATLFLIATSAITAGAAPFAYVANLGGGISVIDTATNTVAATVQVGIGPQGVAITPNGALAYVTNPRSNDVSVIDIGGAAPRVVSTVRVGCGPTGVAVTPNGAFTYVTNACDSTVSVINTATNAVVATVAVGPDPENIAITPDGFFAYTSNFLTGSLSVIDTATNRVVDTIQAAGTAPLGIAIR